MLSNNGLQFCFKLSQAAYQLLGVRKLVTSSYYPNCNGGVERINHTMAQMLAMVANERQDDWYLHLPHVEFAQNNSVSTATGLAPNEVHMGRLPRLPLTVFDRTGVVGHQSLAHDHLAYCDLATDRQKHANDIVRAHHALTVSSVNRRNSALTDALRPAPNFAVGGWAWVYNSASTIRQGVKSNADAKVLKAKLALNLTGPYKILTVAPCSAAETPDVSPLGSNLLLLDLPSDLPGSDARRRVAIERCKPCANPHDSGDTPKYLPAGLTQYVLNIFPRSPYHTTSLKTTFRPPSNGWKWSRSSAISRSGDEVASSRCYTRRIGPDSLNLPGSGKWTSTPPVPTLTLLGRHAGPASPNQPPLPPNGDRGGTARALPQQRGAFPSAGLRLCSPRRMAPSLPRHGTS